MRIYLCAFFLLVPLLGSAEYLDVIQVELKEGCDFNRYVAIKNDFNETFGSRNGYHAEVLMPLQSEHLATLFWVGRAANAAAFGKAWDAWRDGLADKKSVSAKLWSRFQKCSTNISRQGYDIY